MKTLIAIVASLMLAGVANAEPGIATGPLNVNGGSFAKTTLNSNGLCGQVEDLNSSVLGNVRIKTSVPQILFVGYSTPEDEVGGINRLSMFDVCIYSKDANGGYVVRSKNELDTCTKRVDRNDNSDCVEYSSGYDYQALNGVRTGYVSCPGTGGEDGDDKCVSGSLDFTQSITGPIVVSEVRWGGGGNEEITSSKVCAKFYYDAENVVNACPGSPFEAELNGTWAAPYQQQQQQQQQQQ